MDKEILLSELDASTNKLSEILSQFAKDKFNLQPSESQWSAAQIAEHLLLLEVTANKALRGDTIPTNREPDKKLSLIKWAMEDETKRQAPQIVTPSSEIKDAEILNQQLKQQREILREIIMNSELSDACTSVKHPALGMLTRLEWIYFTIYHCDRHLKQIEKLKERTA